MTLSTVAVLRPGDWVLYDGSEHQVLALAGTSVRLNRQLTPAVVFPSRHH